VPVTLSDVFLSVLSGTTSHASMDFPSLRSPRVVRGGDDGQTPPLSGPLLRCVIYRRAFSTTEIALPALALRNSVVAKWVRDQNVAVDVRSSEDLGVALAAGAVLFGARSDASGRRKPYVYGASAVMALAALILVIWPTWTAVLIASPLLGVGFGTYWAVAIALLTQVLPAASDRAKDLGVLNVANALPQVIAPLLTAVILANLGGYRGLFAVSALATTLAAVLMSRVRSVV